MSIIEDTLVNDVKEFTHSSTIAEAITIALKDRIDIYNIKELNNEDTQEQAPGYLRWIGNLLYWRGPYPNAKIV
jgi:hypothetical protein